MRIARRSILTVACALAALVAVPAAQATSVAPPLEVPIPAGGCLHPLRPGTSPAVSYRYASRTNIWRVRPVFGSVVSTGLPGAGKPAGSITATTVHTGRAASYLVLDARQVGDECYLLVRLPAVGTTTNNRRGWVKRDLVVPTRVSWQLEVDLSDRMVRLYKGRKLMLAKPVVIGQAAFPTPKAPVTAPFAMYDAVAGKASDFTGTWELATTAHNEVDSELGRVGLHGRGGASLADPLGSASSHGCVRADNATVNAVVKAIGIDNLFGVPFLVTA
jgi:hypothetical protein